MNSIKVKIIGSIIACSLLSVLLVGIISIQHSTNIAKADAARMMELTCENRSEEINALISRIEQSVNTMTNVALEGLDFEQFQTNAAYVEEYTKRIEQQVLDFARQTEGAITAYVRYNPDFTDPTSGIFYSRSSLNADFESIEPTDFSVYDKTDTTHVGWYYIPVENKAPMWMSPYLNENINIYMISYVCPIYVNDISMGIFGMDIAFSQITDIVDKTSIYKTGYAFLTDVQGQIMHHGQLSVNESISALENGSLSDIAVFLKDDKNAGLTRDYEYKGSAKSLVYRPLNNGMRFVLTAPISEIHENATRLRERILYMAAVTAIFVSIVGAMIGINISNPIKKLTKIIRKTSALDFSDDVKMKSVLHHRDEIGVMARAVQEMRIRLHEMVEHIDHAKNDILGNVTRLDEIMKENQVMSETNSVTTQGMAAGIEETSANAELIKENIEAARDNSEEIHGLTLTGQKSSKEVMRRAEELKGKTLESSNKTLHMFESIKEKMQTAMEQSKAVEKINELTGDIKSISSQTNLLALNASIEAARAGEAGKGFSVVATEIGTLAAQTLNTVEDINNTVTGVNHAVSNMFYCIESTMKFMEDTVLKDYKTYQEIAEQYEKDALSFMEMIDSINGAIQILNENIVGVVGSVNEINSSINQATQGVSEIAEKSNEVARNIQTGYICLSQNKESVNELKDIVDQFQL